MSAAKSIVLGGASGFWGEAAHATAQLLATHKLDFLVYDYLAEITLSIMARARAKDPTLGYATDFVAAALEPNLTQIAKRGIRVISNAGGVNPQACAAAVRKLAASKGLDVKVAVVTGDDLTERAPRLAEEGVKEMFSGETFPPAEKIASINAYLGAFPIAAALDKGADIVITGRCVDSAVTLGACIHAFGWGPEDFDLLAAGSLAGHLIECGPQVTGGNFTDWREAGEITRIGYPLAEISADGAIEISKPEGTTGVVSPLSVGEQMLYEIGDPQAYLLPDVSCDFSGVTLEQAGENLVRVAGAKGGSPPSEYKVSATWADGFRAGVLLAFNGFDAREKARTFCEATLAKAGDTLRGMNALGYSETDIEISGGETGLADGYGEVTAKVAVRHADARAVGLFLRELTGLGLSTPAGLSIFTGGGRPKPSPVVRLFSFLCPKDAVQVSIDIGEEPKPLELPKVKGDGTTPILPDPPETIAFQPDWTEVPLISLAVARSGDKGNKANIGVMARRAEYMPHIWAALTPQVVAQHFADYLEEAGESAVQRFYLPGTHAMNLLLDRVLGGGGVASLRMDSQGKGFGQRLLAMPVAVPPEIADVVTKAAW